VPVNANVTYQWTEQYADIADMAFMERDGRGGECIYKRTQNRGYFEQMLDGGKMNLKTEKKKTIIVMRFPCCKHCPPANECDKSEGHQVACHYSDPRWNDSCKGGSQVQHRVEVYV